MRSYLKRSVLSLIALNIFSLSSGGEIENYWNLPFDLGTISVQAETEPTISYSTHIQSYGWQNDVTNGDISGTTGLAKRLEGIKIKIQDTQLTGSVEYRTHVEKNGWMAWQENGNLSGTTGESKRLEAIEIRLTGELAEKYDVYYRVHAENFGWLEWAKNGDSAGTSGYAYRLEAIEVKLIEKGQPGPVINGPSFEEYVKVPSISYQTHVQSIGWQNYRNDGQESGTTGLAKRLEGIRINLSNLPYSGGVTYRTHVEKYGWMSWRNDNALSGTTGESKRLEAIEIQLNGEMAKHFDIYYRVHAENFGWMDWAKNGEAAGTAGYAYRLEGIQIKLVKKDDPAPGNTAIPFKDKNIVIEKKTVQIKEKEISFSTVEEKTSELLLGETETVQEGVDGFDTVTYEVTYTNGKETGRTEISRTTTEPVNRIVKVGTRIDVESVDIVIPDQPIRVDESLSLSANVNPSNATNQDLSWSSSNPEIASIDVNGNVIAVSVGTTTITATSVYGNISDSFVLTVLPINIDSITLDAENLVLTEGESLIITATVLPENATDKSLIWSSSDESVVSVDSEGSVTALKVGFSTISVSNTIGTITKQVNIEVKEPTISTIENFSTNVFQHDEYIFPATVVANMSNGTTKEVPVNWINTDVDTSIIGSQFFEGTVEGYAGSVTLTLIINEYIPDIQTNAYSRITINNLSQSISISMNNYGEKSVIVNKIEVYESGTLFTTYTSEQLANSGISTEILPYGNWGMTITYKIGLWLDGSYVKYYVSTNNVDYEFQDSLERDW